MHFSQKVYTYSSERPYNIRFTSCNSTSGKCFFKLSSILLNEFPDMIEISEILKQSRQLTIINEFPLKYFCFYHQLTKTKDVINN